jgi:hypothetical protein
MTEYLKVGSIVVANMGNEKDKPALRGETNMLLNKYSKINYSALPSKAQESYNFQKASAVLAEFGFITNLLKYDWYGADFFAQHINGDWLKIQLKGRLVTSPSYEGKDLFIMFEDKENSKWYLYPHDELTEFCRANYPNAVFTKKGHSRGKLSSWNSEWLRQYEIPIGQDSADFGLKSELKFKDKKITTYKDLNFDYKKCQLYISQIDKEFLSKFNPKNQIYKPQTHLEPCPFEGDLKRAKVILLLANPGFTPKGKRNASTSKDHDRSGFNDWGLWGLSSKTSKSMHQWWRARLSAFVNDQESEDEWRKLSLNIAAYQAVPWASESFHEMNRLPSKQLSAATLKTLGDGKIFVVMRQKKYWREILDGVNCKVIYTNNPLSSYLTAGNMDINDFELLKSTLSFK